MLGFSRKLHPYNKQVSRVTDHCLVLSFSYITVQNTATRKANITIHSAGINSYANMLARRACVQNFIVQWIHENPLPDYSDRIVWDSHPIPFLQKTSTKRVYYSVVRLMHTYYNSMELYMIILSHFILSVNHTIYIFVPSIKISYNGHS